MTYPLPALVNGRPDALISPAERGLAYGDGVFRTLPVIQGKPQVWPLHYAKLNGDCCRLSLACPSAAALLEDIQQLYADQGTGVAKIIITRGAGGRGYAISPEVQSTRIVMRTAMPDYPSQYGQTGVHLTLCNLRLAHQPRLAGIKHLNRLENVLARMEWQDPDIFDGLLLDQQGSVIEGTMSNILLRFDARLLTPDLKNCGVEGVTRDRILKLAPALGLQADISDISLDQLMQADEVILCNSLFGAWQVASFNGKTWQSQPLAEQLRNLLQEQHEID
ncbi:aminodeoxychorismate lyase [Methylovorus mays]|uniref:aminodeoxychorismate lyase n=1 Tax=Methylovorus mays TaxID=184077 RepID=UPI001E396123|nr:aminodeoxychorismate lyase [Methylovorus mays]MCB5206312.1 aminodeoxychorismate lyase [Methylovorus mays]